MSLLSSLRRTAPKPVAVERQHTVAGRVLPLRIVPNARARRLTLRIDSGGQGLRITTPLGIAIREVDSFLARHQGWLETRLSKYPERAALRPGVKLPFKGVSHRIAHEPQARGTVSVTADEDGPVLLVCGDRRHLQRRLADFLKREARATIEPLVAKHCASVGRKATAIRFRDTISRWGSCTSDGKLSFSWRIMMAPPVVIDYLVAHEVAHLREMNHGADFWALCRKLCPQTEQARAWLKKNGGVLQAIPFDGE